MKEVKIGFIVFLLVVCLIATNGCKKEAATNTGQLYSQEPNAFNADVSKLAESNIIVAGGGTTLEFGKKTTYEFNAVQTNGKTTGHIILKFRAGEGALFIKVDCLRLFENKATMSGIITQMTANGEEPPPFIYLGARVSFTVQDNGEGADATVDLVSDIGEIPGVPASCADEWPVYLPLDGNVQISK